MTSHTPSPHQSQSVTSEARVSVSGSSGVLGTVIASDEAVPSVALPSLPLLRLLWFVCASELSADVCAPLFDVCWARDPSQWLSAHKSNGFRLLTCLSSLIDLLLPSDGGVPSLYCMSLLSEGKAEVERRCWVILCATALQAAAVACRAVEGPDQVAAFASAVFQKLIPMLPHLPVGEFKGDDVCSKSTSLPRTSFFCVFSGY